MRTQIYSAVGSICAFLSNIHKLFLRVELCSLGSNSKVRRICHILADQHRSWTYARLAELSLYQTLSVQTRRNALQPCTSTAYSCLVIFSPQASHVISACTPHICMSLTPENMCNHFQPIPPPLLTLCVSSMIAILYPPLRSAKGDVNSEYGVTRTRQRRRGPKPRQDPPSQPRNKRSETRTESQVSTYFCAKHVCLLESQRTSRFWTTRLFAD